MNRALLSIVLIAKNNTSAMLKRALLSVLEQTYENRELFVVDANLWDSPESLSLQEDLAAYPQFTYIQPPRVKSDSGAKNRSLPHISGEYVCFLSGNEVWSPQKCELQINQLEADTKSALSVCDGKILYSGADDLALGSCLGDVSYSVSDWLLKIPIKTSGQAMYRTAALGGIKGFAKHMSAMSDIDAMIRIKDVGHVLFLRMELLEGHLKINGEYYASLYRDSIALLKYVKYLDILLLDKQAFFTYNVRVAVAAFRAGMAFDGILYSAQTFVRAPIRSLRLVASSILRSAGNALSRARSSFSYRAWTGRFIRNIVRNHAADLHIPQRRKPKNAEAEIFSSGAVASALPEYCFMGGGVKGEVVIPEFVESISKCAFAGCRDLESVVIPSSVREIGVGAFMDCPSLRRVTFAKEGRLSSIGNFAFAGCVSLSEIALPANVSKFGRGAFAGCSSLRLVDFYRIGSARDLQPGTFPEAVRSLPRFLFAKCTSLTSVYFGVGSMLKKIGRYTFFGCDSLSTVWIEASLTTISQYAFAGCRTIQNIVIMNLGSLRSIYDHAFMNCPALKQFTVPPFISRVESETFKGCEEFTSVHIPKSCKSVEAGAFADCKKLAIAYIDGEYTKIRRGAFMKATKIVHLSELPKETT